MISQQARYEEMASNGSVTPLKFRLVGETNSPGGPGTSWTPFIGPFGMTHTAPFDRLFLREAGWWFGCHFLFSHILGMSSSQLTNIFQRGGPTTNQEEFADNFRKCLTCRNSLVTHGWLLSLLGVYPVKSHVMSH